MHTHYCIVSLENGQPERGMYTCSAGYETPELARQLGPGYFAGHVRKRQLALARIESIRENDGFRMVRQTVLELI